MIFALNSHTPYHMARETRRPAATSVLYLRGHHLLCIQHYKGLGYSPEFVANMSALVDRLRMEPQLSVHLSAAPDHICRACPNLHAGACHDDGANAEQTRVAQDQLVLDALGLHPGDRLSWAEITERIRARRDSLPEDACGACRWLKAGHCGHISARTSSDLEAVSP